MSLLTRAIVFGIEFIFFVLFSIYRIYKVEIEKQKRFSKIIFVIGVFVLITIFSFLFKDYIFLSNYKLFSFSLFTLVAVICIYAFTLNNLNREWKIILAVILTISSISLFLLLINILLSCNIINNGKILINEVRDKEQIITITMFKENQIGFTADSEGNIKSYIFYYKENEEDEIWQMKELKASEVKTVRLSENEDTYISKTINRNVYCDQERKNTYKYYITTEEIECYTVYLNLHQMIEIKK